MLSVSHVEHSLKHILEERADVLARETGCIERQRKFSGADLLQTLVFGWLSHPDASLETLASMAVIRQVHVTDTALHNRFTKSCAQFLHAVLEEMTSVVVEASQDVPLALLRRFEAVVLEDSSSIALPKELAEQWQGCGGAPGEGQAAVKLHTRRVAQTGTGTRTKAYPRTHQRPVESVQRRPFACRKSVYRRPGIPGLGKHCGSTSGWQLHAYPCPSQNPLLDARGQATEVGRSASAAGGTDQRALGACR